MSMIGLFRSRRKSVHVRTNNGFVEGFKKSYNGKIVNVFLGIPYSNPPVGDLRFKKPEPIESWNGVRNCQRYQRRAPQTDHLWDRLALKVGTSEDCLYLNVIAPDWNPPPSQPDGFAVLFYLHGGGFLEDSAVRYHYSKIACMLTPHNIVVITVQYRLGYLGFFSTGDSSCVGNFGLWDQVAALQWVNQNIKYFGGNPGRIIVAGHSSGAACADLLCLSPWSRELFHGLILMGGNADCPWAVSSTKRIVANSRSKAESLGWKEGDNLAMIAYLRTLPSQKFGGKMLNNEIIAKTALLPVTPIIDGDLLPDSICNLRRQSLSKDSIAGVAEYEALLFASLYRKACVLDDIELGINLLSTTVHVDRSTIANITRNIYLQDEADLKSKKRRSILIVKVLSDMISNYGCISYANSVAELNGKAFLYVMQHYNPTIYTFLGPLMPFKRATHGVELVYLFDASIFVSPYTKTKTDKKVAERMTTMWTNFIKCGDPNVNIDRDNERIDLEWKAFDVDEQGPILTITSNPYASKPFMDGKPIKLLLAMRDAERTNSS